MLWGGPAGGAGGRGGGRGAGPHAPLPPPTGAAGGCTVSVSQPPVLEVDGAQGAATVPCSFSTAGCPPKPPTSLWFRLGARRLESLCSDGCQSEADKFTVRMDLARGQVSLTVHGVTANDSALYICGVAVTSSTAWQAKRAGEGTALVVRGPWAPASPLRHPDRGAHRGRERCPLAAPAPPGLLGQGRARASREQGPPCTPPPSTTALSGTSPVPHRPEPSAGGAPGPINWSQKKPALWKINTNLGRSYGGGDPQRHHCVDTTERNLAS